MAERSAAGVVLTTTGAVGTSGEVACVVATTTGLACAMAMAVCVVAATDDATVTACDEAAAAGDDDAMTTGVDAMTAAVTMGSEAMQAMMCELLRGGVWTDGGVMDSADERCPFGTWPAAAPRRAGLSSFPTSRGR